MVRVAGMLAVALLAASCLSFGEADKPEPPLDTTTPIANQLLDIEALQVFRQLNLSNEQMTQLRAQARETAQPAVARAAESKASDKLRRTVAALRAALIADQDDDKIERLGELLDELREAEKDALGDNYEMSEAARDQAPKFLRTLAPGQVAGFIGALAAGVPDPFEAIADALGHVRGLKDEEWKQFRESLSEEVGRLVAGLDLEKAGECGDKVVQLLIVARSLSDEEFKTRKPDLDKKARAIVGDAGPVEVLRHEVEFRLAELLSNPRLEAALSLRLKLEAVSKTDP